MNTIIKLIDQKKVMLDACILANYNDNVGLQTKSMSNCFRPSQQVFKTPFS